ncbi:MAG: 50S ribosomal protein L21 [Candidatus Paceibacterota bacterium]
MATKKLKNASNNDLAVIATGGKQYKVSVGDVVKTEKIKGELKLGDKVIFDKVLLKGNDEKITVGMPFIEGAKVEGELIEIGKNPTLVVLKYKAKSRYLKKNGHRQPFMKFKVNSIN